MSDQPESVGECRVADDGKHLFQKFFATGEWKCIWCEEPGYPDPRPEPRLVIK